MKWFACAIALGLVAVGAPASFAQTGHLEFVLDDACPSDGDEREIAISVAQTEEAIVGGQFFFSYDPAQLELLSIDPVEPFSEVIFLAIDEDAGIVDLAIHVPFQPPHPGAIGPLQMATLQARVIGDECDATRLIWRENAVTRNRLSMPGGDVIEPGLSNRVLLLNSEAVGPACPEDIAVRRLPNEPIFLDVPTLLDTCDEQFLLDCTALTAEGDDISADVIPDGGVFPFGVTTIRCESPISCTLAATCEFTVEVDHSMGGVEEEEPEEEEEPPAPTEVDLAVDLESSRPALIPGELVVMNLRVRNLQPTAVTGTILFLDFGVFLDPVSASNGGLITGATARWNLGAVAGSGEVLRTFTATMRDLDPAAVPQFGIVARVLHDGMAGMDIDPTNDRDEVGILVLGVEPEPQLDPQVRPPLPLDAVAQCDPETCGACGAGSCTLWVVGLGLSFMHRRRRVKRG
jgi:hypothetical protein